MREPDFSVIPENPVKILRKELSLSQSGLAKAVNLTLNTIRDVEKGLTPNVPTSLLEFFDAHIGTRVSSHSSSHLASHFTRRKLMDDYEDWKYIKRSHVFLPEVSLINISSLVHPFTQYREQQIKVETAKLCEWLCIPRFVLLKYETGQQKKMPRVLKNFALPSAHMSQEDIARLANLGVVYYEAMEQRRINANRQNLAG